MSRAERLPVSSDFTATEVAIAGLVTVLVGVVTLVLLTLVNRVPLKEEAHERPVEQPISVKPVLDMTPILKLGTKKKVRYKLPEMWKKIPPVKKFKARSAPSKDAKDDPEDIPESPVATGTASAPPPDADVAKEVDEDLEKVEDDPDADSNLTGEGDEAGSEHGTETDPLKARAISLYRSKLIGWFNSRFAVPVDAGIPCAELKGLSAVVAVSVGGDRSVTSFNLARPSGNAIFDRRVRSTMQGTVGQQLPPPPKNYPDILESTITTSFQGRGAKCTAAATPPPSPAPPSPAPARVPAPEPPPAPSPDATPPEAAP